MANEQQPIIIVRKKVHGHGHHGGAWKLAYADLVTAMMAFFLVMWIVGLAENTKHGIAAYFSNPGAFVVSFSSSRNVMALDGKPPPSPDYADENDISTKYIDLQWAKILKASLEERKKTSQAFAGYAHDVAVAITDKGLQIDLCEDGRGVFFNKGSTELNDRARPILRAIADVLGSAPRPWRLIGHTDRTGSQLQGKISKMDFALDRARSMFKGLTSSGYPGSLCRQISSRADTNPLMQDDPAHISNNRVTILLPFEAE